MNTHSEPRGEKLSKRQLKVLREYKDTDDSTYLQGVPGASELWRPLGLLDWHGEQYGTHFYSITPAGIAALTHSEPFPPPPQGANQ